MAYCVDGQVLGKVNCSVMGQSKKERERGGRSGGTRRTKEQVLVVDKEKGRRGCLAGKQRARSIKTGQLGRGFLGPGFPLGSRVCSIRKIPRPLYPDSSAIIVSIPLSGHPHLRALFMPFRVCHATCLPNRFAVLIANFIFLCYVPVHRSNSAKST
jgi:hypothetical protein